MNPLRGDGEWARKSLFGEIFIISGYNIRKIIWILLVLIQNETEALQNAKIKYYSKKGRPLGGFEWSKSHFQTADHPLSVMPTKK